MKELNRTGNKRGMHPNSRKNLKAGPGRPCNELSLTHLTREKLDEPCPYDSKGRTWLEYLVERWLAHALENATYFRELIERLEGKVVQAISGEGEPLTFKIIVASEHDKENIERVMAGERTE